VPTASTKYHSGPPTVRERRERALTHSPYRKVGPQPGPQTQFLSTPADIAMIGGANGGGKTFALLLEPTRHVHRPRFGAVFLRNTMPQIKMKGGAWETSTELYGPMGAFPNLSERIWHFPSGATVSFKALQYDHEIDTNWGGSQIPLILMDQAETFSERMIFGMLGRNRTDIGIRPYLRMSASADPDCFLRDFIDWWLDEEGYAIPERSGVIRWFARIGDAIHWADHPEQLTDRYPKCLPLSFTFIPAKLSDNTILEELNPEYRRRLENLPYADKMRLLGDAIKGGNWKIKIGAGMFQEASWKYREYSPSGCVYLAYWDTADTSAEPGSNTASTAGVLLGKNREGVFVEDVAEVWASEFKRDEFIHGTALLWKQQYGQVDHWFEREPGSGGKRDANRNIRLLQGFVAKENPEREDKVTRAKPWASYVESGNVYVIVNERTKHWVRRFIDQHRSFPLSKVKDLVDAASGAFRFISVKSMASPAGGVYGGPDVADPYRNL
jgi:predicted phage terminase large subunit-like protein